MLPPHVKLIVDQIGKATDRASSEANDRSKNAGEQQKEIAVAIQSLMNEIKGHHAKQEANEPVKRRREIQTIAALIAAALFSAALAILAACQLYEMVKVYEPIKASAEAAKTAADVARDAVNLAAKTAERQLRAYLTIEKADVIVREGKIEVTFSVKNSGQTPAYDFTASTNIGSQIANKPFAHSNVRTGGTSSGIIGPGNTLHIHEDIAADNRFITALRERVFTVYVWGQFEYKDAFNHPRRVDYRARVISVAGEKWLLQAEREGNYAD